MSEILELFYSLLRQKTQT